MVRVIKARHDEISVKNWHQKFGDASREILKKFIGKSKSWKKMSEEKKRVDLVIEHV